MNTSNDIKDFYSTVLLRENFGMNIFEILTALKAYN